MSDIYPAHQHSTPAHPTRNPCIAAKLLSPWKYYHTHKTAIFCKNGAIVPIRTNRTVKPNIPIYSAFLDIETTHSTCRVNGNISNGWISFIS